MVILTSLTGATLLMVRTTFADHRGHHHHHHLSNDGDLNDDYFGPVPFDSDDVVPKDDVPFVPAKYLYNTQTSSTTSRPNIGRGRIGNPTNAGDYFGQDDEGADSYDLGDYFGPVPFDSDDVVPKDDVPFVPAKYLYNTQTTSTSSRPKVVRETLEKDINDNDDFDFDFGSDNDIPDSYGSPNTGGNVSVPSVPSYQPYPEPIRLKNFIANDIGNLIPSEEDFYMLLIKERLLKEYNVEDLEEMSDDQIDTISAAIIEQYYGDSLEEAMENLAWDLVQEELTSTFTESQLNKMKEDELEQETENILFRFLMGANGMKSTLETNDEFTDSFEEEAVAEFNRVAEAEEASHGGNIRATRPPRQPASYEYYGNY